MAGKVTKFYEIILLVIKSYQSKKNKTHHVGRALKNLAENWFQFGTLFRVHCLWKAVDGLHCKLLLRFFFVSSMLKNPISKVHWYQWHILEACCYWKHRLRTMVYNNAYNLSHLKEKAFAGPSHKCCNTVWTGIQNEKSIKSSTTIRWKGNRDDDNELSYLCCIVTS